MMKRRAIPHLLGMCSGVVALTVLSGCAAAPVAQSGEPVDVAPATPPPATSTPSAADQESCEAFSDVSTVVFNANVDMRNGRMTQQEYDGWLRLASRMLDRIPVRGEGDVSDAITTLKQLSPPIPATSTQKTNIDTPEWNNATSLAAVCQAVGNDLPVQAFTGG